MEPTPQDKKRIEKAKLYSEKITEYTKILGAMSSIATLAPRVHFSNDFYNVKNDVDFPKELCMPVARYARDLLEKKIMNFNQALSGK